MKSAQPRLFARGEGVHWKFNERGIESRVGWNARLTVLRRRDEQRADRTKRDANEMSAWRLHMTHEQNQSAFNIDPIIPQPDGNLASVELLRRNSEFHANAVGSSITTPTCHAHQVKSQRATADDY